MREMVMFAVFATQTAPAPTATAVGPRPTGIVRVAPVKGSIRSTGRRTCWQQTAPSPKAAAGQLSADGDRLYGTLLECGGLNRWTVASPGAHPDRSPPDDERGGRYAGERRPDDPSVHGIDPRERGVAEDGPDRAQPNGSAAGARAWCSDVDGARNAVELLIDPRDLASHPVRNPHAPHPDGDSRRCPVVERDGRRDGALGGVDLRQRPVVEVAHPDRALSCRERAGADPHRHLADDRVRARGEDADGVCAHTGEAAGGIPPHEEHRTGNDDGQYHRRDREHRGAAPQRRTEGALDDLCQLGLVPDGRERGREPVGGRLIETNRAVKVFEPLLAEVAKEDVQVLLLVLEERLRRLRDEDLAAVTSGAYSRRPMHGEAGVAAVARDRLARVQAHPHLDLDPVGPGVRKEGELSLDGGEKRVARAREGNEERVALGVHLIATVGDERSAQQTLVVGQNGAVAFT
jgi:hypothetical protein